MVDKDAGSSHPRPNDLISTAAKVRLWPWAYIIIGLALLWLTGAAYYTNTAEGFRTRNANNWLLHNPEEIRCPRPVDLAGIMDILGSVNALQQTVTDTAWEKARKDTARELARNLRGNVSIGRSRRVVTGTPLPQADLVDALFNELDRRCTPEQLTIRVAEIQAQNIAAERQIYLLAYIGIVPSCLLLLAVLWMMCRGKRSTK